MPKDVDGIIDEIDRLVDEQLNQPIVDDYNVNRYDRCWHCNRQWHGFPLTEQVQEMHDRGIFDENYRVADDDTLVLCPGSDFIGPVPPFPDWQMRVPGYRDVRGDTPLERVQRRLQSLQEQFSTMTSWTDTATEALSNFGDTLTSAGLRTGLLRWWRTVLPRGATITQRSHGVEIGVGDVTALVADVRVRTAGDDGDVNLMQRVNRAARRAMQFRRVEVDVLTPFAPRIGGTWTPLTAPGVTRHPDGDERAAAIDNLVSAAPPALNTLAELTRVLGVVPVAGPAIRDALQGGGFRDIGRIGPNGIERRPEDRPGGRFDYLIFDEVYQTRDSYTRRFIMDELMAMQVRDPIARITGITQPPQPPADEPPAPAP